MAVASPRVPTRTIWRRGVQVNLAAERDGLAWSLLNLDRERADAAFEAIAFSVPAVTDDGLDRFDPADEFCLNFASPSVGEHDPNQQLHDQYAGTVFDR